MDLSQGLRPGGWFQRTVFSNQGLQEPLPVVDVIEAEMSANTKDRSRPIELPARCGPDHPALHRLQGQGAAAGAMAANGFHDPGQGPLVDEPGFGQGPGGAQGQAGPAKGAFGLLQGQVPKGSRSGVESPVDIIQDALHNQFLVSP